MEWQQVQWLINIAVTIGGPFLGWFARKVYDRVEKLEDELAEHKVVVARDYVPNVRFSERINEILDLLRRIDGKLDGKADK